jgi:hypothetical protein
VRLDPRQTKTGHPHWWTVLSVGIALMALVAAISGTKSLAPYRHAKSSERLSQAQNQSSLQPAIHVFETKPSPSIAPTTSMVQVARATDPLSEQPASSALPATPAPAPDVADSPPSSSFEGFFESPVVISTNYPISSDGAVTATATWSEPVSMTLTLNCSLSNQSKTGGPGIALTFSGLDSQCVISLSEPFGTPGVVDYSVDITQ